MAVTGRFACQTLPFAATIGDEDAGNSGGVPPFLTNLYDLLLDPSTEQFICWGAGGQSIVINDALGLASEIIPRFWKHNNLRSFFRQLNTYGFQRAPAQRLSLLEVPLGVPQRRERARRPGQKGGCEDK